MPSVPSPDLSSLPPPLAERVAAAWEDFPADVLDGLDGEWRSQLPRVWAASDFVAGTCLRDPDLLAELARSGALNRPDAPGGITQRVRAAAAQAEDEAALRRVLRTARRRELLRIAWRDLAGEADLHEVMSAVTELADACLDAAAEGLHAWLAAEVGEPAPGPDGRPNRLTVLGLGKLGGEELNFSSDIDLMFAYPAEVESEAGRRLSAHEFFTRLAGRLIRALGDATEDGFVFRVDMRLRPNGDSGPMALSFDAMEHYYQTHGREWERYALIKARTCAGDRDAGEELLDGLRPFVYRKYIDFGAIEAIREMKGRIDRELQRKEVRNNIKLGPGGIREIEFIAQSFQLIRGGRERELQDHRLLTVLERLGRSGLLTVRAVRELTEAYVFLRRVENRLQMANDRQTQTLPSDDLGRERLAFASGFDSVSGFERELRRHTQHVQQHFEQIFTAPQRNEGAEQPEPLKDVWLGALSGDAAHDVLAQAGFDAPDAVLELLERVRGGSAYRSFSRAGRDRMDRLMPLLLGAVGLAKQPGPTLSRLVNLLEAIGRRSVYLALLVENPMALSQLVKLCAASGWIANWISQHPILLDELLNPALLYARWSAEQLDDELRQWLARLPEDDLEMQMESLREFRHGHVLRVAAADITGALGPEEVGASLCDVAEVVLAHTLAIARSGTRAKLGQPRAADGTEPGFAIIGYGKLGSLEMGYTSDLDLIFLYADEAQGGATDGARSVSNEVYFARLGQRMLHVLSTHTPAGKVYEVDTRLRPSGNAGPLVTSFGSFAAYQRDKAWTWEHQALVRARPVAGDRGLGESFGAVRREILCRRRDPEALRRDVVEMRDRMIAAHGSRDDSSVNLKQDRGGIVDIEFMVQYCVLCWAADCPELADFTDNIRILQALGRNALLDEERVEQLIGAYRRFLATEHQLKLTESGPLIDPAELADERRGVSEIWEELLGAAQD